VLFYNYKSEKSSGKLSRFVDQPLEDDQAEELL